MIFLCFSGSLIPGNCLKALCNVLSQDSAHTYTETPDQNAMESVHLSMPVLLWSPCSWGGSKQQLTTTSLSLLTQILKHIQKKKKKK